VKLEPHRVVPEGMAGQARPVDRILAFLDVLFGGAAAVVELEPRAYWAGSSWSR
jgi:hypothetical protein